MRSFTLLSTITATLLPLVSCVPYITIDGANFINNSTGNRFDVIGIDYQPGGSSGFSATADPLSDATACLRDAILMQRLGVNTIRVYNVDANIDHNECVSIFNAAGIYMILDVNSGLYGQYLDRTNPSSTYTSEYLAHVFQVIEAFAGFPNLLGFWAANEVINEDSSSDAPAYIRAVVRDMKQYIAHNVPRPIGVGYSAADVSTMLDDTWNYLSCSLDDTPSSKIDFFGLNDYEWCGDSSFTESGYDKLATMFGSTSIPVVFSEYGCNKVEPRTFTEVGSLYSSDMSVLSGGMIYEWTQEENDYGLVDVNSTDSITLLDDYTNLQIQYDAINLSDRMTPNKSAESITASTCATASVTGSAFPSNFTLPSQPSGVDSFISSGVTSASKGSLVAITATAMPVSVFNYTNTQVNDLNLVQLACNDMNAPGLLATYKYTSASCSYATATGGIAPGSTASGSGSGNKNAATRGVPMTNVARSVGGVALLVFGLAVWL